MGEARQAKVFLEGFTFAESPRWHDQELWFSDFHDNVVLKVNAKGQVEKVVEVEGEPSGLGWLPDGRLLVVSMEHRRVMRMDPDGLKVHADLSGIATWHCNDMVVSADGTAYVGNFGAPYGSESGPVPAKLARITPDGEVHAESEGLDFPNGMVITPDGSTLIVSETLGGRISAFDIEPGGALSNQRVWADGLEGTPDGMALDAEGKIWVALGLGGEVVRIEEGGRILDRVRPSENIPSACMLGGPDRKTLYVTTTLNGGPEELAKARASRIECIEVDVPGAGLP